MDGFSAWQALQGEIVTENVDGYECVPYPLPIGTGTSFGTITDSSLTAYQIDGGEWVAFERIHGRPAVVSPLVVLR